MRASQYIPFIWVVVAGAPWFQHNMFRTSTWLEKLYNSDDGERQILLWMYKNLKTKKRYFDDILIILTISNRIWKRNAASTNYNASALTTATNILRNCLKEETEEGHGMCFNFSPAVFLKPTWKHSRDFGFRLKNTSVIFLRSVLGVVLCHRRYLSWCLAAAASIHLSSLQPIRSLITSRLNPLPWRYFFAIRFLWSRHERPVYQVFAGFWSEQPHSAILSLQGEVCLSGGYKCYLVPTH